MFFLLFKFTIKDLLSLLTMGRAHACSFPLLYTVRSFVMLSIHRFFGSTFPHGSRLRTYFAIVLDLISSQPSLLARIVPIVFGSPKALHISSFKLISCRKFSRCTLKDADFPPNRTVLGHLPKTSQKFSENAFVVVYR